LRLDFVAASAARFAVERWHYSRTLPTGKLVRIGVWEDDTFRGVVVFGSGSGMGLMRLSKRYGISNLECCELVRVALRSHKTPVSRIVAIAIKMLRVACPGIRLILSFADPSRGHHGGIYQAGNWVYTGLGFGTKVYRTKSGKEVLSRTVTGSGFAKIYGGKVARVYKIADVTYLGERPKHRYLFPIDRSLLSKVAADRKPHPKRPS